MFSAYDIKFTMFFYAEPKPMKIEQTKASSVQFREVEVQQMNKNSQMSVKPGSIHTVQTPVYGH